jgi:hypothetical protein
VTKDGREEWVAGTAKVTILFEGVTMYGVLLHNHPI